MTAGPLAPVPLPREYAVGMHTQSRLAAPSRLAHRARFFISAIFSTALLAACASSPGGRDGTPKSITLAVAPSQASVGQTVTATAIPDAPLSDRATIDWITTGGTITTVKDATVARLKFTKPGTFKVTAKLMVDSTEVSRSTTEISVAAK